MGVTLRDVDAILSVEWLQFLLSPEKTKAGRCVLLNSGVHVGYLGHE